MSLNPKSLKKKKNQQQTTTDNGQDSASEAYPPQSTHQLDRVKRIWFLSPMRAAKVQASLRIRAVSPEPSLLAHTNSESRGIFRQKARSLAPLNGWACAVKICHHGMLEDTDSLDGAQLTQSARKVKRRHQARDAYPSNAESRRPPATHLRLYDLFIV